MCCWMPDQGCDIELHIAGRLTDGKACLEAINDRGLTHVVVHGPLDREGVRTLLYQSDALVLASRTGLYLLAMLRLWLRRCRTSRKNLQQMVSSYQNK